MSNPNQGAHKLAVGIAESARQVAITPTSTAAQVKAATIAYYKAVLASGRANGVQTGARQALINLGAEDAQGQTGD